MINSNPLLDKITSIPEVEELEKYAEKYISVYSSRNAMFYADLMRSQYPNYTKVNNKYLKFKKKCSDKYLNSLDALRILVVDLSTIEAKTRFARSCYTWRKLDSFQDEFCRWTNTISGSDDHDDIRRLNLLYRICGDNVIGKNDRIMLGSLFETIGYILLEQLKHIVAMRAFRLGLKADPTSVHCIEGACDTIKWNLQIENLVLKLTPHLDDSIKILLNIKINAINTGIKRPIAITVDEDRKSDLEPVGKYKRIDKNGEVSRSSVENRNFHRSNALTIILVQYARAYHAFSLCRFREAMEHIKTLDGICCYEMVHSIQLLVAKIQFEQMLNDACILSFERLMQHFPDSTEGLEYYSTALYRKNDEDSLHNLCLKSISTLPNNAIYYCAKGNLLTLYKDKELAVKAFEKAIKVEDSNVKLRAYATSLLVSERYLNGQYRRMDQAINILIKYDPFTYKSFMYRGMLLFDKGYFDCAIVELKQALVMNPSHWRLEIRLAVSFFKLKQIDDSLQALGRALDISDNNSLVKVHLAGVLLNSNRTNEAHNILQELIENDPGNADGHYMMAIYHKFMGTKKLYVHYYKAAVSKGIDTKQRNYLSKIFTVNYLP
ncbi:hypothetical protein ACOME3_004737 [Neoechinorhynchus agilis]